MVEIVYITPVGSRQAAPPEALGLLKHNLHPVVGPAAALDLATRIDLAMVDARDDLAAACNACLLLGAGNQGWPVLLVVPASGMSVIGKDWQINDFVVADAAPAEFEARIRLQVAAGPAGRQLVAGPVTIDEAAWVATAGGHPLDLTYTEFELLKYLVAHPGRVLTREQLLSEVWGYDYFGGTRTVDVHIRRLRAKLGPEHDYCIGTVRNVGYRFMAKR